MKHFRPQPAATPLPPRLGHVDPLACRDLWAAVLLTALRDLCDPKPRSSARTAAERWVGNWPGGAFRSVCTMAGMDPRLVHRGMTALMALPANQRREQVQRVDLSTGGAKGAGAVAAAEPVPRRSSDLKPIPPDQRRDRVAAMFGQGIAPSDMPASFAARGHKVSMSQVWGDIRYLRAAGRIGYLRNPRGHRPAGTIGVVHPQIKGGGV